MKKDLLSIVDELQGRDDELADDEKKSERALKARFVSIHKSSSQ
jgi:hypothetical protein